MIDMHILEKAAKHVGHHWREARPEIGLILGSGWGEVAEGFEATAHIDYADIPGLGKAGVSGHSGRLLWAESAGLETFIFQGRRHWYEGQGWEPVAIPIHVLKSLGARIVILTNAAGGIRKDLVPGTLMMISDHVNMMGANPLAGPHHPFWGPRFPDLTQAYDLTIRRLLCNAARTVGETIAEGVYLAMSGPCYETPAEVRSCRALGADAVGMSTVPEACLAHAAGLRVGGLSCITNAAAGISRTPLSHQEVTAIGMSSLPRMRALMLELWREVRNEGI
jgi:purine-nucleoside phosphorylase